MTTVITVIRTDSGNFNLFGTHDGGFSLQGNLTEAELRELIKAAKEALKAA